MDKKNLIPPIPSVLDGGLLIQPFANQAQSANARSKPDLVGKVASKYHLVKLSVSMW